MSTAAPKVFIVESGVAYEGTHVIGVFSSRRAALERVREELDYLKRYRVRQIWEYSWDSWTDGYHTIYICETIVQDIKPKPIPIAWKLP